VLFRQRSGIFEVEIIDRVFEMVARALPLLAHIVGEETTPADPRVGVQVLARAAAELHESRERFRRVRRQVIDDATDRLCELNVLEQALNVCRTTVVQDAWRRGQKIAVHAWIYAVSDGLVRDLNFCATDEHEVAGLYASAVKALTPAVPVAR
jgi:hypothetical protein